MFFRMVASGRPMFSSLLCVFLAQYRRGVKVLSMCVCRVWSQSVAAGSSVFPRWQHQRKNHSQCVTAVSLTVCLSLCVEAKDVGGGGDNWSYKSCKAPVKSSPPTNQHPVFFTGRMPFLSPNQQCQSTEGKISYVPRTCLLQATWGLPTCLWPLIALG